VSGKPSLQIMRLVATGLLVAMVVIYLLARRFETMHPAIAFVRAFAEAATVGALADWFAVTALFRRPLGMPFPHTAIIPRSKDRIGQGLGEFLESNFLSPELLASRLASFDLLGEAAGWALQPGRATVVARAAAEGLPRLLDLVDDRPVEEALKAFAGQRLREIDLPSALANALDFMTTSGRHRGVLDHLIRAADALLTESEGDIRARVRSESGVFARLFGLDRKAADAIVGAARAAIGEMAADPECDLRRRLDAALQRLVADLRSSPDLRAEVDALKQRLLDHPDVQGAASAVWRAVKRDLQSAARRTDDTLSGPLAGAIEGFARHMRADDELRAVLNERVRLWLVRLADARGGDVSRFVASVIQSWDARTIIARIEDGVGADLQYIRISGTLIGGSVGVILHIATLFGV
jgi:uncharacterized membrane-anchored protein YjiN (DUF445 family)